MDQLLFGTLTLAKAGLFSWPFWLIQQICLEHFFCVRRTGSWDARTAQPYRPVEGDADGGKCSVLRGSNRSWGDCGGWTIGPPGRSLEQVSLAGSEGLKPRIS